MPLPCTGCVTAVATTVMVHPLVLRQRQALGRQEALDSLGMHARDEDLQCQSDDRRPV